MRDDGGNRKGAQASGGGKKSTSFSVKLGRAAAIALVFGLVAGVMFQGSSYLMGRALGTNESGSTASLNTGTISPTSTSSAITVKDVSDIVENVLPLRGGCDQYDDGAVSEFLRPYRHL